MSSRPAASCACGLGPAMPADLPRGTQPLWGPAAAPCAVLGLVTPRSRSPHLVPLPAGLQVESVELTRLGGNAVSSKTFDLVVRTKSDHEHQFR